MNALPEPIDAAEVDYLYVDVSTILNAGLGLFSSIPIFKDEIIAVFKGEKISNEEANKRALNKENDYFVSMLDGSILDSKFVDCFAKFANDGSGSPNTFVKNNAIITINEGFEVCLVALRKINAGQEILCSYGAEYWKNKK